MSARVASITIAPVKGLALVARDDILLERHGVTGNRRLYLIDPSGRLVNGKRLGTLVQVVPELDLGAGSLGLSFPDGSRVVGEIVAGEPVTTEFYGRPVTGRVVHGDFGPALAAFSGEELRLVLADGEGDGVDRGGGGAVTMLGVASLARLAGVAGVDAVDPRRFRMLFGVDGIAAHEEDAWIGEHVAIGEAVVRVRGNVGRCAVTTHDPDSGVPDLPTLQALSAYRGVMETTEPLPFGVVGSVVSAGRVAVGDRLSAQA